MRYKRYTFHKNVFRNRRFNRDTFKKCDLTETKFIDCTFHGCKFQRCYGSGLEFNDCTFSATDFTDCFLEQPLFNACEFLGKESSVQDCSFIGAGFCGFSGGICFNNTSLSGCEFDGEVTGVLEFISCSLDNADFSMLATGALSGEIFIKDSDITDADFSDGLGDEDSEARNLKFQNVIINPFTGVLTEPDKEKKEKGKKEAGPPYTVTQTCLSAHWKATYLECSDMERLQR